MRLPELTTENASRDFIDAFGGYNHNIRIGDSEFYDMKNLTSDYYPTISPRGQRGTYLVPDGTPAGLIEKDALCWAYCKGTTLCFFMNNNEYEIGQTDVDADVERNLVSMGAYVIIMPDKMYINTKDTSDFGKIEASFKSVEDSEVTFSICKADGTSYTIDKASPEEPKKGEKNGQEVELWNGFTWLDTSSTPASLKVYAAVSGQWASVFTTYIKISYPGIGNKFNAFDGVRISGIDIDALSDLNETMVIYAKEEADLDKGESSDWIAVIGVMDDVKYYQKTPVTIERKMPEMDFLIESNNRLWGCRYGFNSDGEVVNEIRACKQGDFKNWECFPGLSTDSYYVSLGTDGEFTGAFSYLGYPTFFKENCLHTIYGNYPAEYQVQDTACRGVQKGSHKSLAMVNEALYYKSRSGICSYSGSLPTEISSVLGNKTYSEAVGCSHKGKYYVSMKDAEDGKFYLFVCDTNRGLWHKEDELFVRQFCSVDDEIYFIGEDGKIKTLFGSGTKDTEPIGWMAETGVIGCSSPDKKYVSRITIRLKLDIGSMVRFSIQYDSEGEWFHVCSLTGHNLRTNTLPIRPKRCDHFRLRMEGSGGAKIFSISKTIEQGSEL